MYKVIFLLVFIVININAKTYTLYLASSKYQDVVKKYYHEVRFHAPDFYDIVVRTHKNKNYSLIIRKIPDINKAKKIQKLFHAAGKYKDSYIKMYEIEPKYETLAIKDKLVLIKAKKEKPFKQEVEDTNEYILASTMFNTAQYKESYEMFYKLFLKHNYNLNINYFLALSAFSLEKYDEAIAAYERVLIIDPDFNQARYDYARVLYKLKQKQSAKREFNTLLQKEINQETKDKINEFLKVLNKENKKTAGTAQIAIGFSRSSNVNNGLISPEYSLPGLNDIIVKGEDPIADSAMYEMANLNLFHYIKNKPIRIKNSFLVYNKHYINQKDENIVVLSYKPSIEYFDTKRKQTYLLELSADKILRKTDEDFYVFAISPKLYRKDFLTYLKYQRIMYTKESNQEKDFEKIQLYAKINLFKNMNFYTNLYKNRRIKDLRNDIDKYTIANGINIFYSFTKNNKINLNYQLDYSKYKYENLAFDSKRSDRKHLAELSYDHNLDNSSIINISTSYTKNYSNQDAYIYENKEIKLNYLKAFKW